MRSLSAALALLATVCCTGCSQPHSPTAASSVAATSSSGVGGGDLTGTVEKAGGHAAKMVPFKGTLAGVVTVTFLEPPLADVFVSATGTATHLGRFAVQIPHRVSFATAIGQGEYTFTAANGDTVTATFVGQAQTDTPIFSIVENATITGGTGRFAGATGSFTAHRRYDTVAGTTSGSFEGVISSPGAGRD